MPPSEFSDADTDLVAAMENAFEGLTEPVERGATWTTDAPYRETAEAIAAAREKGLLAVEMEAAGLYAFAQARGRDVICFAHVTNQMAQIDGDFEKGQDGGAHDALDLVAACARSWRARNS
jgi:purine-nucleoside phosphorylase